MRHAIALSLLVLLAACGGGGDDGPVVVGGAVALSAGNSGTCAIGSAGGLTCWGAVPDGTPNDTTDGGADVLGAVAVEIPAEAISVALGRAPFGNNGCLVGSDHVTYCWGDLYDNDVGVPITGSSGIGALAGGGSAGTATVDHSTLCVTRTDNLVRCWGAFYGGGRGTDSVNVGNEGGFSMTPSSLSPSLTAYGASVAYQWGCAIRTDSLVACWGTRHRGQLGGTVADTVQDCTLYAPDWCQPGPATVAGGHKYRSVSANLDHACAVLISGGVECWGRKFGAPVPGNWQATCGSASDCVNTPTAVTLPGNATRVAVGLDHACALLTSGSVYCWGANDAGQLGRPGGSSATPVAVSGGFNFTAISAGAEHTCAIEAGTGVIGCWGANGTGQLGDGTTEDRDHPVAVIAAE